MAPLFDFGVVATEEFFGDFPASEVGWASPLGAIEDARFERFVEGGVVVAEDSGEQAGYSVDDADGG